MSNKTYLDFEKKFHLQYQLKCKQKAFAEKQKNFFGSITVPDLARKPLVEQAKFVDFVTRNSVDSCTTEQVLEHYDNNIKPYLRVMPLNNAGLGNIAYILLKINDTKMMEEWSLYLKAKYINN